MPLRFGVLMSYNRPSNKNLHLDNNDFQLSEIDYVGVYVAPTGGTYLGIKVITVAPETRVR